MPLDPRLPSVVVACLLSSACTKKAEETTSEPRGAASPVAAPAPAKYVGTATCAPCHEDEHEKWRGSNHDLAMQHASAETVLGSFEDVELRRDGERVRFLREGDAFFVEALDGKGARRRFRVVYTFGVEPLQQYLVETEPGRLQAFPFAWDTRPKTRGGQRWFHLLPNEHVPPGDPLHWTGPSYNWNWACADCHSTAVKKGYDRDAKRYATTHFEIDVGCEACHGPGSRHVALVEAEESPLPEDGGFVRRLPAPEERPWSFAQGRAIAMPTREVASDELSTCAPCHSRRADLGGEHAAYHDRYRLSFLEDSLYFDDGQIRDEVYVYGSFLQSKMHAAGVLCSDCHDPHRADVRAAGNALCGRCHRADVFDTPDHHFHQAGKPGSLCTDCHMPSRAYMVVDFRGDHRFGVPNPALSARIGAPDVCTGCHDDRTSRWADEQIAKRFEARAAHPFAEAFHAARGQEPGADSALVDLVAAASAPAIVRATALEELRNLASPSLPATLMRSVHDSSPLVRRAAASAARELPTEQRVEIVRPLLRDPSRSVRIEAVAVLLGVDARGWSPRDREALKQATAEYLETRTYNADRGEGLVDLAYVAALAGDVRHAEETLREALLVDPTFTAAYVNLADLYRGRGRDQDAEALLRRGLPVAADRASMEFALGLTLVRLDRHGEAVSHLRRAHRLRPDVVRFGYVYAIAQYDTGRPQAAIRTLEQLQRRYPANRDVLRVLVAYHRQIGHDDAAARYARLLEELDAAR